MSFSSYLTLFRVQQAKTLLRETRMRNYEIATAVGFSSYKLFAQCFQKLAGISRQRIPNQIFRFQRLNCKSNSVTSLSSSCLPSTPQSCFIRLILFFNAGKDI